MKRIVIKVGTSSLTQGTQQLSPRAMVGLVQQMALLQQRGCELLLVSSGAIATGRQLLSKDLPLTKQVSASIGQVRLMQVWSELFALFDLQVGQVLLTLEDFSAARSDLTQETLSALLQHKIVPILNENDAVAAGAGRIGDNDNLAALAAALIGADTLILLTDQDGLYTADPRLDPEAKLISVVEKFDEKLLALGKDSSTALGTGGMRTKIEAARRAAMGGVQTIIASSLQPNVLLDLADGKKIGTLFQSRGSL